MAEINREKIFNNILFYFLIICIILIGIYSRTRFYLAKAPLWLDEMMLAYSFTDYSLSDILTKGLGAFQKAPPFFSFIVLSIRKLFGINELTLRFIPFLSGILSLFGMFLILKQNIKSKFGIVVGLSLYSFCVPLIYFCAEFKPYGWDIFITLILLLSYKYISFNNFTHKKAILYAACSFALILLSFPTIFLIPAIVLSKITDETNKFDTKLIWILAGILCAGLYLYSYDIGTYNYLKDYWYHTEKAFGSYYIWTYLFDTCKYFIYNFDNIAYTCYIVIFAILGFIFLYQEKKSIVKIAIFSMFFLTVSSILQIYPLKPKMALFMIPFYIIFITKIFDVSNHVSFFNNKYILNTLKFLLCLSLIVMMGINIPYINLDEDHLVFYNKSVNGRTKTIEDRNLVKDVSLRVLKDIHKDDVILASEEFKYSLKYYKFYYNIDKNFNITTYGYKEIEDPEKFTKEFLTKNKNKHIWIIGRNNETYFTIPKLNEMKQILSDAKFNYEVLENIKKEDENNIYLIFVK